MTARYKLMISKASWVIAEVDLDGNDLRKPLPRQLAMSELIEQLSEEELKEIVQSESEE
jgi:hypothetical protein